MSPMSPSGDPSSSFVERQVDAMIGHPPCGWLSADALAAIPSRRATCATRPPWRAPVALASSRREASTSHRTRLVLVLRATVLALHDHAGRDVHDAHRRIGLVDVLAAGADARKVSMRRSDGLIVMSLHRIGLWRMPPPCRHWCGCGPAPRKPVTRCTRWVPDSNFMRE